MSYKMENTHSFSEWLETAFFLGKAKKHSRELHFAVCRSQNPITETTMLPC
jgi:hypothetical protein